MLALAGGGELHVSPLEKPAPKNDEALTAALQHVYAEEQEHWAENPPPLDLHAAAWAANQFYRACQFLVVRDAPPEKVMLDLGSPCPSPRGPAVDFSVDLIFRHLPDLYDRARRLAPNDPLVTALLAWARTWALSSPGVKLEEPPPLETFAASPGLWRLYVDRVAARMAEDRWPDPRVAAQLRTDLGAHEELASAIAGALDRLAKPSAPSLPPASL